MGGKRISSSWSGRGSTGSGGGERGRGSGEERVKKGRVCAWEGKKYS